MTHYMILRSAIGLQCVTDDRMEIQSNVTEVSQEIDHTDYGNLLLGKGVKAKQ